MEFLADSNSPLAEVLSCYDTPAYVRRGVQLAHAREQVFHRCQTARAEQLCGVRAHLRALRRTISHWSELRNEFATERDYQLICDLEMAVSSHGACNILSPSGFEGEQNRHAARARFSVIAIGRRADLRALLTSIERFNRRWAQFLVAFDLTDVNRQVNDYNRYYLLEKECAMRSARLAARGFVPAQPISHKELIDRYPLLPIPQLS